MCVNYLLNIYILITISEMGCIKSKHNLSQYELDFLKIPFFAENSILVWQSTFMQDCPGGKLTPDKFLELYGEFFPGSIYAEQFCEYFFTTFDIDLNGYIDFEEYLLAINRHSSQFQGLCFKICHILYIRKPKVAFSVFQFVLLYFSPSLMPRSMST